MRAPHAGLSWGAETVLRDHLRTRAGLTAAARGAADYLDDAGLTSDMFEPAVWDALTGSSEPEDVVLALADLASAHPDNVHDRRAALARARANHTRRCAACGR